MTRHRGADTASPDGSTPLTGPDPRDEIYAQTLASGGKLARGGQLAAYENAGFKRHDSNASRKAAQPRIIARVAWLQAEGAKNTLVTIESSTTELETARLMAMNALNTGDMIRATMGKAKVNGLLVDKHMVGMKNINDMTEVELRAFIGTG